MDSRSLSTILCKPLPYLRRFVKICKDVVIEPPLLPLTGETLPPGSDLSDAMVQEKSSLTAAVLSTSGGIGTECDKLVK